MNCCIILHNMVVKFNELSKEEERFYLGLDGQWQDENDLPRDFGPSNSISELLSRVTTTQDQAAHSALRKDIEEHLWNWRGNQ